MDHQEEVLQAQFAKQVLDNPAYMKAWAELKTGIVNAMSASPMGDEKTHNRLVIALQIANKLQKSLEYAMATGKMAEIQLEEKSKLKRVLGL